MKKSLLITLLFFSLFVFCVNVSAAEDTEVSSDVTAQAQCPIPDNSNTKKDLEGILKIFRIVAPITAFALSVYEAIRCIGKGDINVDLKKVWIRFGKRMLYVALLYFVPTLVQTVFKTIDVFESGVNCEIGVDYTTTTTKKKVYVSNLKGVTWTCDFTASDIKNCQSFNLQFEKKSDSICLISLVHDDGTVLKQGLYSSKSSCSSSDFGTTGMCLTEGNHSLDCKASVYIK